MKSITLDTPNNVNLEGLQLAIEVAYSTHYADNGPTHGIAHAASACLLTASLANIYALCGDDQAAQISSEELFCVQIAALYHDAGRQGDGEDCHEWEMAGASACFQYLVDQGYDSSLALRAASAIVNKDYKDSSGQTYYELSVGDTGELLEATVEKQPGFDKDLWQQLVHDADALEVIRARKVFDVTRLDCFKRFGSQDQVALDIIARLTCDARGLIWTRGDGLGHINEEIKKRYNNKDVLNLILEDYKQFSLINDLLCAKPAQQSLADFALRQPQGEQAELSDEWMNYLMHQGKLYVRGVAQPYKFFHKKNHSESLTSLEIRKALRNTDSKQGNPNRSVTFITHGITTFSRTGFLSVADGFASFSCIKAEDFGSGDGKKYVALNIWGGEQEGETIEDQHQHVLEVAKLGGKESGFGSTHNEGICTLSDFNAIFFTLDPNTYCKSNSSRASAIIEAIYEQGHYFKQTGRLLPIFEYSGNKNFIQRKEYSQEAIFDLWREMLDQSIEAAVERGDFEFITLATPDQAKLFAMFGYCPARSKKYHEPADIHYPAALREQIDAMIEQTLERNRQPAIEKLQMIIDSLTDHNDLYKRDHFSLLLSVGDALREDSPYQSVLTDLINGGNQVQPEFLQSTLYPCYKSELVSNFVCQHAETGLEAALINEPDLLSGVVKRYFLAKHVGFREKADALLQQIIDMKRAQLSEAVKQGNGVSHLIEGLILSQVLDTSVLDASVMSNFSVADQVPNSMRPNEIVAHYRCVKTLMQHTDLAERYSDFPKLLQGLKSHSLQLGCGSTKWITRLQHLRDIDCADDEKTVFKAIQNADIGRNIPISTIVSVLEVVRKQQPEQRFSKRVEYRIQQLIQKWAQNYSYFSTFKQEIVVSYAKYNYLGAPFSYCWMEIERSYRSAQERQDQAATAFYKRILDAWRQNELAQRQSSHVSIAEASLGGAGENSANNTAAQRKSSHASISEALLGGVGADKSKNTGAHSHESAASQTAKKVSEQQQRSSHTQPKSEQRMVLETGAANSGPALELPQVRTEQAVNPEVVVGAKYGWQTLSIAQKIVVGIVIALTFPISLPIFLIVEHHLKNKHASSKPETSQKVASWRQPTSSEFKPDAVSNTQGSKAQSMMSPVTGQQQLPIVEDFAPARG